MAPKQQSEGKNEVEWHKRLPMGGSTTRSPRRWMAVYGQRWGSLRSFAQDSESGTTEWVELSREK